MPRYSACFGRQLRQLHAELVEVQPGDLFVEVLGQRVDADRILVRLGPQGDLGDHLVGERVRHHERRMARGAAEVHQPPFGQQEDRAAARASV